MDRDQELANQFAQYAELAKENKNIDITSLMLSALKTEDQSMLSAKQRRIGYLVSIGFPPVGLIYAAKFYFSGKHDGKHAAWICVILTIASIVMFLGFFQIMFSSSGLTPAQVQQAPSQLQQILQD